MRVHDLCGYIHDPRAIANLARRSGTLLQAIKGSGKGKSVFLWHFQKKFQGKVWDPHNQTIGDCVSHGITGAGEDLQWVMKGLVDKNVNPKKLASEPIYGLSRVEIGGGGIVGDGSIVAWGIDAARKYGFIPREKFGNIDLSIYDGQRAKAYGKSGCPDSLESVAKEHPIRKCALIEGPDFYFDAIDVIASGGVVVSGSNWIYSSKRDAKGFCKYSQSGGHCVYFRGYDDSSYPGIVYQQSWGPDVPEGGAMRVTLPSGKEIELPPGAFFITPENFNAMHKRDAELWGITAMTDWAIPDQDISFYFYHDQDLLS